MLVLFQVVWGGSLLFSVTAILVHIPNSSVPAFFSPPLWQHYFLCLLATVILFGMWHQVPWFWLVFLWRWLVLGLSLHASWPFVYPLFEKCLFSHFSFVVSLLALISYVFWSRLLCHMLIWQHCLLRGGHLCLLWLFPLLCRSTLIGCIPVCHSSICCLWAFPMLHIPADVLKCFSNTFL